jgi:hypothetical protein
MKNIGTQREHRFTLIVRQHRSYTREDAEMAVLIAFAKRDPDCQEFILLKTPPKKSK